MQSDADLFSCLHRRWILIGAVTLAGTLPLIAQNAELQQKIAAVKQAAAQNQQRLHQYRWTETTQLTLKGDAKPPTQNMCQYGSNGQVLKTAIGPPPEPPSGGRLKQRMIAKKKEEMQDYMGDVKQLLSVYVPPDPVKLQQAYQTGNASIAKGPMPGTVNLTFHNYEKTGDQLSIIYNTQQKKISQLSVKTYMQQPSEAVTLDTNFASLPDGINYAQKTVLNATAKKLIVTTTNSHYQKLQ